MGKVAFCWELGGGLGHITGFLPMAKRLLEQGHEVFYIVKNVLSTEKLIGQYGVKVFQAPVWHPKLKNLPIPMNYAEILFRFGYLNEERLFDMVLGWKNLFEIIAPDIVIFDHSPTANMASRGVSVKRAMFGTGFCSPPRTNLMPSIRPWTKIHPQRLQNSENRALQSINGVLGRMGVSGLDKLSDLFDCDEDFLATFPELDHYQGRGSVRYWGARMIMDVGEDPVWPDVKAGPKIFAYLKAGAKGSLKVLEVLKNIEANVLVYASGFAPNQIKQFQTERLVFSPKMFDLKKVCQECDLVICHAGHATVARALLGGVPVVMLPTQAEQFIMSINMIRFGAATMVNPNEKQPDYAGAIHRALMDKNIKQKAEEFAARHADFDQKKQVAAIVGRIEELITPVS
jgi:UDP-N-acetylglucosamine:LPS N-acetylglucosamine transferase